MTILTLPHFYRLAGVLLLVAALRMALRPGFPHRGVAAAFWAGFGAIFLAGDLVSPRVVGYAVIALVLLATTGRVVGAPAAPADPARRQAEARRLGNRLFVPSLLLPVCALLLPWLGGAVRGTGWALLDPRQAALPAVSGGAVAALVAACVLARSRPAEPLEEGTRLLGVVGWTLLLPQLLAALGGIFASAGVGTEISRLLLLALPHPGPFVSVVAYATGMALFTACLGNAFAAFAVVTGGIGLPFIVGLHGGNPAIMAALGMLTGYCGTLVTPLAANFNLVPAILLELPDRHAVIKAQAPMAAVIFVANVVLLWLTVYRF